MDGKRSKRKYILERILADRPGWVFDELCWRAYREETSQSTNTAEASFVVPDVYRKSFSRTLRNGFSEYTTHFLANISYLPSGLIVLASAFRIGGNICSQLIKDSEVLAACHISNTHSEDKSKNRHYIEVTFAIEDASGYFCLLGSTKLALNLPIAVVYRGGDKPSNDMLNSLYKNIPWKIWRVSPKLTDIIIDKYNRKRNYFFGLYDVIEPSDHLSLFGAVVIKFTSSTQFSNNPSEITSNG